MPAMANITVKDSDGTTDRVFTALSPSGGDGSSALWRFEDMTRVPGHRITAEIKTMWNGPKTARRAVFSLRAPIVQATSVAGVNAKVGEIRMENGNWIIPQDAPSTFIAGTVALGANLMASALIKSAIADGFAPT